MYTNPRNASNRFQKNVSSRTKDINNLVDRRTHAQMDARTHMSKCRSVPPMVGQLKKTGGPKS